MATQTRKTIGVNPLDAVVPDLRTLQNPARTLEDEAAEEQAAPVPVRKERMTIHLPVELIERMKNTVYWTPGLTLAELSETALARRMDELEADKGGPFPQRGGELKGGRPLKGS